MGSSIGGTGDHSHVWLTWETSVKEGLDAFLFLGGQTPVLSGVEWLSLFASGGGHVGGWEDFLKGIGWQHLVLSKRVFLFSCVAAIPKLGVSGVCLLFTVKGGMKDWLSGWVWCSFPTKTLA